MKIFAIQRNVTKSRNKVYVEHFREHKQNAMSRNLFIQLIPWLCVLFLVFILGNKYFIFAAVISGSMVPTFEKGDLVLMQTIDKNVTRGDIVMFGTYGIKEPIVHRVVGFSQKGNIITKGDANPTADDEILGPERIAGKAILIGKKPIVLKGAGYSIRPQEIGSFTVLSKLPKNFVAAEAFEQFRTLQPLIIFFSTIFYFFILIETRLENNRRFNRRNGKRDTKTLKQI